MDNRETEILGVMYRLGLQVTENGLLTYSVLEGLWATAWNEASDWADDMKKDQE